MDHVRFFDLLAHQWQGYAPRHRSRRNLVLHAIAVPAFLVAHVVLVLALVQLAWWAVAGAPLLAGAALAVQGRGHGREVLPPEPFTGALNAAARLLAEQWITFPRFVLSGGWWAALKATRG